MRFLVLFLLLALSVSCKSKKEIPCFKEAGASNCSELFDVIQENLRNEDKILDLRDCYDEHCK